ncbi:unnamed protein product [Rhizopus stolonifer]
MLRVRTILYNERLWLPIQHHYKHYGSTQVESLEESTGPVIQTNDDLIVEEEYVIEHEENKGEPQEDNKKVTQEITKQEPRVDMKEQETQVVINEEPQEVINEEPLEDTKEEPLEDTKEEPLEDTKEEPLEDTKEEPLENTKEEPLEDTKEEPLKDTKEEPLEDTKEEPLKDTKEEPQLEEIQEVLKAPVAFEKKQRESNLMVEVSSVEEPPALGNTSIISSSSSIAPVTPPASHRVHSLRSFSTKSSLFRRETVKLNDKRKNLTRKIKNVSLFSKLMAH